MLQITCTIQSLDFFWRDWLGIGKSGMEEPNKLVFSSLGIVF